VFYAQHRALTTKALTAADAEDAEEDLAGRFV
jgi:hypothetical protein